jgi:hypothetical protein
MSPDKQNIAIAEACGWTVINNTLCHVTPDRNGEPEIEPIARLPDYLNDLNAMHEAEKVLEINQWGHYKENLTVCAAPSGFPSHYWHATATQRAEAFLKTVGKWEDDKC